MTQTTNNPLALCGQYQVPSDVTRVLQELTRVGPVIAPGGTTLCSAVADGHTVLITSITPEKNDTYVDRSSVAICFKATFLQKLAAGLGVEWLAEKTRRLDNFQHPQVASIVVGGRYRDYTGEWREISASHTLDLRDDAAHGRSEKDLARARKYIHQLAETMAQSRAIAKACVDRTLAKEDVGRPMFMGKVYRTSPINPEMASSALFGPRTDGSDPDAPEELRQVEAEVRDTEPSRSTGASAGFLVPNDAQFGADAGKPITSASDDTLSSLYDQMDTWLQNNGKSPHASGVLRKAQAIEAEVEHRRARSAQGASEEAPF